MLSEIKSSFSEDGEYIFQVYELNENVRDLLQQHYGQIMVRGEISNLSKPASGHLYFTLKDHRGAIRCAFFRGKQTRLSFQPEDGDHVVATANLSVYVERGDYQLVVESLRHEGDGDLQHQFLLLKKKLEDAGYFASEHKLPLPTHPKRIGIITSASTAALQDVLNVLRRRCPTIPISLYCAQVQGQAAPAQLIQAIHQAVEQATCDILLLVRGGGSIEDLWAFNDESLARTLYHCPIPIITGIGHEIDFTIADFVADQRAPTPSAAAELAAPDQQQLLQTFKALTTRLQYLIYQHHQRYQHQLLTLKHQLKHPTQIIHQQAQHIDQLYFQLDKLIHRQWKKQEVTFFSLANRLVKYNPEGLYQTKTYQLSTLTTRLKQSMYNILQQREHQWHTLATKLDIISPLATLDRGYAIAKNVKGKIIHDTKKVTVGESINVQLSRGSIDCTVTKKHD
jgi:exodeoxyribonuclease VII large subunit